MTEYKKIQKGKLWVVVAPNGQNMGAYKFEWQADERIEQLLAFEKEQEEAAKDPLEQNPEPTPNPKKKAR